MSLFSKIGSFFAPAPHIKRLPKEHIDRMYPKYRWGIIESTFIGYSVFYLVRTISLLCQDMEAKAVADGGLPTTQHDRRTSGCFPRSPTDWANFDGRTSDRSKSLASCLRLLLTALCNILIGSIPNFYVHLSLWALNGFIQGMGWPPCGRSIGHWFSLKERGTVFAIWNIAHNVGGGLAGVIAAWAASHYGRLYAFTFRPLSHHTRSQLLWRFGRPPPIQSDFLPLKIQE
jgi:OPA family glycerol-3-phosphate transporter-like MFS transporter